MLDGRTDEWPQDAAALADADYLYFRLALPDEVTLQASSEPVTLLVDLDSDRATGWTPDAPRDASPFGFDLGVHFSPRDGRGGVSAYALEPGGAHTPIPADQVGLRVAPTHAASTFEVRLARRINAGAPLAALLASPGRAAAMILLQDQSGATVGWSDPETFVRPAAASHPPRANRTIPPKPKGALRVVSWNVRKSGPMTNAGPFSRVLQALNPDIVLIQEWDAADAPTLQAWFTAVVSGEHTWSARTSSGPGVAIVAPSPVSGIGPGRLSVGGEGSAEDAVRWVAGVVQTPLGDVAVASVHLACCGGAGTPEDQRRQAEAAVINAAMREAYGETTALVRVIAGDLNLVGSRAVLDTLRAGLDVDASDLEAVDALCLGDPASDTWADPATPFTPARLDYTLVGDSTVEVVQAFVLDTTRLGEVALARMGLDAGDTAASDHRPVVVDLRLR